MLNKRSLAQQDVTPYEGLLGEAKLKCPREGLSIIFFILNVDISLHMYVYVCVYIYMNFKTPNCVPERVNFIEYKLYLNKPELH